MMDDMVPLVAILMIGILEAVALFKGVNGTMFSASTAVIGGIAGWKLKAVTQSKKRKKL